MRMHAHMSRAPPHTGPAGHRRRLRRQRTLAAWQYTPPQAELSAAHTTAPQHEPQQPRICWGRRHVAPEVQGAPWAARPPPPPLPFVVRLPHTCCPSRRMHSRTRKYEHTWPRLRRAGFRECTWPQQVRCVGTRATTQTLMTVLLGWVALPNQVEGCTQDLRLER